MTHIDKLRELAQEAQRRFGSSWWSEHSLRYHLRVADGTCPESDPPLIAALSPHVVVRLLDAAQAGRGMLDAYARADEDDCPLQEAASIVRDATAALRAALDALEKMDAPLPEKVQLIQEDDRAHDR